MKKTYSDGGYHQWYKTTIGEWEFIDHNVPATGKDGKKDSQISPYADYAAEAEFTLLDEEIDEKFDYETNHHHFAGSVEDILGKYDKSGKNVSKGKYQVDAEEADKYDEKRLSTSRARTRRWSGSRRRSHEKGLSTTHFVRGSTTRSLPR